MINIRTAGDPERVLYPFSNALCRTIMMQQELEQGSFGLILSGALIAAAELLIFFGHLSAAVTIHAINLIIAIWRIPVVLQIELIV
jgi:hypothetical protein